MAIADIDRILTVCQLHIIDTGLKGTEIEDFLTRFLLVHICGEYEKEIERIVFERAEKTGDPELASYLKRTGVGRGLRLKNLRDDLLGKFSDKYREAFEAKINVQIATRYSNIVTNRHLTAHGDTINMTFDELVTSYPDAKNLMTALLDILRK